MRVSVELFACRAGSYRCFVGLVLEPALQAKILVYDVRRRAKRGSTHAYRSLYQLLANRGC